MTVSAQEIANKVLKIVDKTTQPYRTRLNSNIHVLDFSYSALKISDPDLTQEDYTSLVALISSEYKNSTSIKSAMSVIKDPSTVRGYTAFVRDPEFGTFIVSASYESLQKKLASILKKVEHASTLTSTDTAGRIQANIGHISASFIDSARSPLELLIRDVAKGLPLAASNRVMQKVFELEGAHDFESSYEFQRPDFDIKSFNKILGKSTVYVTLHGAYLNNRLAVVEKRISTELRKYIESDEFIDHILNSKGSPSLLEDIVNGVAAIIKGRKETSKHTKKQPKTSSKNEKGKGQVIQRKLPPLRKIDTGKFYSITSLQNLLNANLVEQIKQNMGTGMRRDILNLRTGRFAESAKVERLSQSRAGMITAFYSYMKNPYSTFSKGGRQQYPRTRDPKLLIAKSIREIAATQVGNRMRAVLV